MLLKSLSVTLNVDRYSIENVNSVGNLIAMLLEGMLVFIQISWINVNLSITSR